MCSHSMDETMDKPKEKVTTSNRRNNKPLMEKRRRQRINECLGQLKTLVLQAMKKDTTQYSKLEKADILEMTVKHLKMVQRQQMAAAMTTDPNVVSKYRAGFNECAAEISRYLDTVNGGSPELKARVMNYLANCTSQFPVLPVYQGMVTGSYIQLQQHSGYLNPLSHQNTYMPAEFMRAQNVDNERHVQYCNTQATLTSPNRLVPSPSGSDSGLSDSSLTQDENGNYSHLDKNRSPLNHRRIKTEQENFFEVSPELRHRTLYSPEERTSVSPKRKRHESLEDRASLKRHRSCDNFSQMIDAKPINLVIPQPINLSGSGSMWRPW